MAIPLELFTFEDATEYITAVTPFLEINEAENGLFLGMLDELRNDPPASIPFMAEIRRGKETLAAAIYWERNLIVTGGLERAAEVLAKKLLEKSASSIPIWRTRLRTPFIRRSATGECP
jgi:hypothetical protein